MLRLVLLCYTTIIDHFFSLQHGNCPLLETRRSALTLMLHTGAELIEYDGLRSLETPPATRSHVPLPHVELVNMVKYALGYYEHEVTEEHHGVTEDGSRYFAHGVLP